LQLCLFGGDRELDVELRQTFRNVRRSEIALANSVSPRSFPIVPIVPIVFAKAANCRINIVVAEQSPREASVKRNIRPSERDRYLIACLINEDRDAPRARPITS